MLQFEMTGPFFIQKPKGEPSPRDEIIEEVLSNCKIPFYMSKTNKCEIFMLGQSELNSTEMELDMALLLLEYPPNTYLA